MRRKNGMDRKHRAGLYLRLSKEDEHRGNLAAFQISGQFWNDMRRIRAGR